MAYCRDIINAEKILKFWFVSNYAHVNDIRIQSGYINHITQNDRSNTNFTWTNNLPVVKAGVHSCSPVAPHNSVKLFDGSTVTSGPAAECKDEPFRRPGM